MHGETAAEQANAIGGCLSSPVENTFLVAIKDLPAPLSGRPLSLRQLACLWAMSVHGAAGHTCVLHAKLALPPARYVLASKLCASPDRRSMSSPP